MSFFAFPICADLDEAKLILSSLMQGNVAREGALFAVALAVPPGLGGALLDASLLAELSEAVVFADRAPDAPLVVGLGHAVRLRAETGSPFSEVTARVRGQHVVADEALLPWIRYFGGGSFDARRAHDESCWVSFGTATLILPQYTYIQARDEAVLLLVCAPDALPEVINRATSLLALATAEQAGGEKNPETRNAKEDGLPVQVVTIKQSANAETWTEMLVQAQHEIAEGRLSKVVAARRVTVQLSRAPTFSTVLARLLAQAVDSSVFGIRLGTRIFIGATPETLVSKVGEEVTTEALAGTLALVDGVPSVELEQRLLTSEKDRDEHQFVVQAVQATLQPLCHALSVPDSPGVRNLRRMMHLWTPITGKLNAPCHILDLVTELHPTPAVGGVPQQAALDFIFNHESVERGWYAAPFGWCNAAGDGHFVVSLRSALIAGDKVHVYAGAGIVAASVSSAEYAETELKMGAILGALGLAS